MWRGGRAGRVAERQGGREVDKEAGRQGDKEAGRQGDKVKLLIPKVALILLT